jgi:ribosomal protein L7/L12
MAGTTVIIEGWVKGFEKVKAANLLQELLGYSLSDAKHTVDCILNNEDVFIYFDSREEACLFQEKMEVLGANTQVID